VPLRAERLVLDDDARTQLGEVLGLGDDDTMVNTLLEEPEVEP
jgi:hypothetical protein